MLTAIYEYDASDRSWVVQLREHPGVLTGGPTLAEAREALLDAARVGLGRSVAPSEIREVLP